MIRLAVIASLASLACAVSLTPYALEVDARSNPAGIDRAQPVLSWKLRSDVKNDRQTAYQILAATSKEFLLPGQADLWDSGRVATSETLGIQYRGKALKSFQRVYWRVQVWDASGAASAWSETAEWTAAILDPAAWKAAWISHPDLSLRSGPLPLFRREFTVDRPVRRALALVSGAGFHELRLNGRKVGDHVLAPAWANYRATIYYETFDVTPLLQPGANAIAVLIGNGFFNVAGGRYVKYTGSFGNPRVLVQLHLEYEDGKADDIASNNTWKTTAGPITFSCIYGGEDYDARLEPAGWDRPGFDDAAWLRPAAGRDPGATLRAQSSPPIRVQQVFGPLRVTQPKPGVSVYDLGQNFAGWPHITVSGPAGAVVRMKPGELLDQDGLVTQRSSGGPVSFNYTLKGGARETWAPRFTYYGFRYVEVETTATLHALEGQFVHLDAPRAGFFSTSKELFNRIHLLIDAAVRSNLQHSLTDCPHREKLGWLEVIHLMGPSLLYNWDLRTFLPKVAADMREAQLTSGLVPDIAPEYVVFKGGFRDSPEWGSAAVLIPWFAWQWYGDRQAVADSYPMMAAYANYLGTQSKGGLLSHGLGDWYDIGPRPPGASQLTPLGVTASALYHQDLRVLARAARLLGHPGDAQRFAATAAAVGQAFQGAFYQPDKTTYATGSQASLAMPLVLGLAPAAARAGLVEKLVADIRARDNHTSAGDVGYRYVLQALRQAGRDDVIFDLANQTTAPSYAAQLAAGATSLTEAWDANPRSSQNHLMLGHIDEWFYAGLAGIQPDFSKPGLTHVNIRPRPVGDVTWVKAAWESPRGPIKVDWRIEGATFRLSVAIPPGVNASVHLPGRPPVAAGSGTHDFEVANFR